MEGFIIRNCERFFKLLFIITILLNIVFYFYLPDKMNYFMPYDNTISVSTHKSIALILIPLMLIFITKAGKLRISYDVLKMSLYILLLSINYYLIYINLNFYNVMALIN